MKNISGEGNLLKSTLFVRLFMPYVIIITLFFSAYSIVALIQYRIAYQDNLSKEYELKVKSIGNAMDQELMNAKHIVSSINSSTAITDLYSAVSVKGTVLDSYSFYQCQQELKNIKASSNYGIYNLSLFFKDYDKAYTAATVVQLENPYTLEAEMPFLKKGQVGSLMGLDSVKDFIFNTEFIIYGDEYKNSASSREKGCVLILFDTKYLEKQIEKIVENYTGYEISFDGESVLSVGEMQGDCFQVESTVCPEVNYSIYVDFSTLGMKVNGMLAGALIAGFLISIAFIVIAYIISRRHYSPIGSIERFISSGESDWVEQEEERGDEIGSIIKGIRNLIGENNGYREKMIHISPYAKQGMLRGILNGNMEQDSLQILIDEKYIDLKRSYFVLALTNVVYQSQEKVNSLKQKDAIDTIQYVCQEYSTWEMPIDCYVKDLNNVFLIINSDEVIPSEEIFYKLYNAFCKEIDDENCLITIGVGQVEDEISRLSMACRDAMQALEGMLTGGRNAVYFYEPEKVVDRKEYYFPKDAYARLLKDFKEKNIADLHAFLDELYQKNIKEYDETPETVRLLLDELHILTLNVLKNINAFQLVQIQIEKIEHAATLEEIFNYYHAIYETICKELTGLLVPKKNLEKVEQEILSYIEENYKNPDLSFALLGEKFGVSNKYISMVCKKHLGKTYLQYVQEKRIMYAAELLQSTEKSMEEIAYECGYSNVLTFRRNFKTVMNMNPGDYR